VTADRVERLVHDIEGSAAALEDLATWCAGTDGAAVLDRLESLAGRARGIELVGLGSSRYAALVAAGWLRARGRAAWVAYPREASTPPATDLLVVAISASGATPEVVATARRHRGAHGTSHVVAVTNREDGPLADAAHVVLPLRAGSEASGIATRTFRATLAVLALLADRGTSAVLPAAADHVRRVVDGRDGWLLETAAWLDGAPAIDLVAEGAETGLAEQGALMLREAPRLPAAAHETADWLHTAIYLALPGHRLVGFAGSASDAAVARVVAERGGESAWIGPTPVEGVTRHVVVPRAADPLVDAIGRSIVAELLAAELWRRTEAEERPTG
jgi:fructoselysine-6-P-deglycase FrlB-like protein